MTTYLPAFPPAPVTTFAILRKLDHAFASLLAGMDIETEENLPGFLGMKGGMSATDMVRCKSLVEATRVLVVDVMSREGGDENTDTETATETDAEGDGMSVDQHSSAWDDNEDEEHNMDVARVYEKTIVQLGKALGSHSAFSTSNSE